MSANNLKYHIKHVLNNTEAIKKAVELNMGVSVLSKLAVSEELKKGTLVKIEIEGIKFKRMFNIIYHKDKYFSPAFKAFMEYLKSGRR